MDLGKLEYTKRPARLEPGIVFVLSGGEEREEVFLRPLMEKDFFRQCVHVLFQSREGQGLMPDKMEELWQSARKRKKIMYNGRDYRISSIDKVFLVSDVDEFEPVLVKILSNKDALDKAQWIISNPCFEIWLNYCYRSDIDPEVKRLRYIRRSKRSQKILNGLFILSSVQVSNASSPVNKALVLSTFLSRIKALKSTLILVALDIAKSRVNIVSAVKAPAAGK